MPARVLLGLGLVTLVFLGTSPLMVRVVDDDLRERALEDSRQLGEAIIAFHVDTGTWPVSNDGVPGNRGELSRLVGLAADRLGEVPPASGPDSERWAGGGEDARGGALEDHLIHNRSRRVENLYPPSDEPAETPGWNGPYLSSVPLDPWDRPFVCNVRYLDGARVAGVSAAEEDDHAVFCLSAGPNGSFDTPFDDGVELQVPAGDDIGWAIQGDQTR